MTDFSSTATTHGTQPVKLPQMWGLNTLALGFLSLALMVWGNPASQRPQSRSIRLETPVQGPKTASIPTEAAVDRESRRHVLRLIPIPVQNELVFTRKQGRNRPKSPKISRNRAQQASYEVPTGGPIPARVIACESGGSYTAKNPRSSASGRYQIIDGTWNNYKGYKRAMDAPPDVQDEKAAQLWNGGRGASHWKSCL